MRVTGAVRRVGWGFADQALSSLTNFALTVAVATVSSPRDFGLFATLALGLQLVLVVSRGLTSDPLLTDRSGDRDAVRSKASAALGLAVVAGTAAGLVAAGCGLVAGGSAGRMVVAFAVTLPLVLVQDCARFVAAAQRRAFVAFVSDAVWALGLLAAFVLERTGVWASPSPAAMVLAWGLAGGLGGVVALVVGRWVPRPGRARTWIGQSWTVSRFYVLENLMLTGLNLVVITLVGAIAGLEATAAIRAAVALFGPLQVITLGARGFLVPEVARISGRDLRRASRVSLLISVGMAAPGVVWGAALLVLPDALGRALLGATWSVAKPVLPLMAVDAVATLFVTGTFIGIRAVDRQGTGFRTRLVLAVPRLVLAPFAAATYGARGVATVFALLAPVQVAVWVRQLRHAFVLAGESAADPTAHAPRGRPLESG